MSNFSPIYCFRANYERSNFNDHEVPDWLQVGANWQGYRIWTVPWIADVARILGNLPVENTPESWRVYLESLGLREVTPVDCEDFFEETLYS
jgi:hypothetical protein